MDRLDRLLQLTLERLEVVGLLGGLRGGDPLLVEDPEPDVGAGGGEAGRGHGDAFLVDVVLGNEDRVTAVLELIGHVVRRELLRDGGGIGGLEVGEERRVARLGDHAHEEVAADHHDGDGDEGDGLLAGREPVGEAAGAGPPAVDVGCGDQRH